MRSLLLTLVLVAPLTSRANNEDDAYKAVAEATFKSTGTDKVVDQLVKAELKRVPQTVQSLAGNILAIVNVVKDRKVNYKWEF